MVRKFWMHTAELRFTRSLRRTPKIKAAPERAFQLTKEGQTACVNVISEHMETAPPRDGHAGGLMGYDR